MNDKVKGNIFMKLIQFYKCMLLTKYNNILFDMKKKF